jgi:hypothetical protein
VTSSEPPNPDQPNPPSSPGEQPEPPSPEVTEEGGAPADMAAPMPGMAPPASPMASDPMASPPPMSSQSPAASPPPYTTPAQPPAAMAAQRPGLVTGAGVTMIVLGALIVLFGLFALIAGVFVGGAANQINIQTPGFNGFGGAVAGVIIVIALIFLAVGILEILAGANVLGGRSWARITGIVLAAMIGLLSLPGLFNGGNNGGGVVFSLIFVAANAFIIWALATTGSWFAARAG